MRTPLDEIRFKDEKYSGIYRGVIEDNDDPEKRGRCKIRVFGIHDKENVEVNYEGIPTEKLPWAEPVFGLFEGSISGFGSWMVPLQGSHVFVFFEGCNRQQIRFFASVPAIPTEAPTNSEGFYDPDKEFPIVSPEPPHRPNPLNEPDWHRLGRDNTGDTIVPDKTDKLDKNVKTAVNSFWDEPNPYYAAKYPKNKVFTTHNGITIEIDDTDGEERIHIYHPSNSYIEINKDGSVIIRNAKDKFEIVDKNKKVHIKDNLDETTDSDRTNHVKKNQIEKIVINKKEVVGGNKDVKIYGREIKKLIGSQWVNAPTINLNCTTGPPIVPDL